MSLYIRYILKWLNCGNGSKKRPVNSKNGLGRNVLKLGKSQRMRIRLVKNKRRR